MEVENEEQDEVVEDDCNTAQESIENRDRWRTSHQGVDGKRY